MGVSPVVLIPSFNPDEELVSMVKCLINAGIKNIVVVNDGSDDAHLRFFQEIEPVCTVLSYKVNRGKGAAIKTGIQYIKDNIKGCTGVVTADSDGQHKIEDIKRVGSRLTANQCVLVLGVRDFNVKNIPAKSEFGNKFTRVFFRILYGLKITDTQTGLRGIPACLFDWALSLEGDRFEYETDMLIKTKFYQVKILEVPIQTVYENENKGTHFKPLWDSFRIYFLLFKRFFKYSCSSAFCVGIDLGIYTLLSKIFLSEMDVSQRILFSTVIARIISSFINYFINKNGVFYSRSNAGISLMKYYFLCVCQMLVSFYFVKGLHLFIRIDDVIIKVFVDSILFFISYIIQSKWVFKRDK